jgi:phospholipase/carboxylesterase
MSAIAQGPKIAALSCGKPVYLVVLLHGPGADGQSIIDQALNWAPTMPKAEFLAAEAPFLRHGDASGKVWFDMTDLTADRMGAGVRAAAPMLDAFLDEMLAQRRLPDSHLALVGFSQGAMLALHVGVRRPRQMGAIIAFSGAVYDTDNDLAGEIRSRPPVLMIHGEADPIVPFATMTASKELLKANGVPAKSMRRPGVGHEMDDDGIIAAGDFLTATIISKPAADDDHDHHDHDHDHGHDDHDHDHHHAHDDHGHDHAHDHH